MKVFFFTLPGLLLLLATESKAYIHAECDKKGFTKVAVCEEIVESKIEGDAIDKITDMKITISKNGSPATKLCIDGKYHSQRMAGGSTGWVGTTFEAGSVPREGSHQDVTDQNGILESIVSSRLLPKGSHSPSEYKAIVLDTNNMTLTFKTNTGILGFATLKLNCVAPLL